MEGWRQTRLGKCEPVNEKTKNKTALTLTGLLMEGLGARCGMVWGSRITFGLLTIQALDDFYFSLHRRTDRVRKTKVEIWRGGQFLLEPFLS
jgi:hypothetical protein